MDRIVSGINLIVEWSDESRTPSVTVDAGVIMAGGKELVAVGLWANDDKTFHIPETKDEQIQDVCLVVDGRFYYAPPEYNARDLVHVLRLFPATKTHEYLIPRQNPTIMGASRDDTIQLPLDTCCLQLAKELLVYGFKHGVYVAPEMSTVESVYLVTTEVTFEYVRRVIQCITNDMVGLRTKQIQTIGGDPAREPFVTTLRKVREDAEWEMGELVKKYGKEK